MALPYIFSFSFFFSLFILGLLHVCMPEIRFWPLFVCDYCHFYVCPGDVKSVRLSNAWDWTERCFMSSCRSGSSPECSRGWCHWYFNTNLLGPHWWRLRAVQGPRYQLCKCFQGIQVDSTTCGYPLQLFFSPLWSSQRLNEKLYFPLK